MNARGAGDATHHSLWEGAEQELNQGQGQHGPAPEDKMDEASASASWAVSQPALRSLPATLQDCTVPAVHCNEPFISAQVPSTLALHHARHLTTCAVRRDHTSHCPRHSSVRCILRGSTTPCPGRETMLEVDLGESSSLLLYYDLQMMKSQVGTPPLIVQCLAVPGIHCGDSSASAQDSAVLEIDLGASSPLVVYRTIHQTEHEPAPDEGGPPASAMTCETMPKDEPLKPAPSGQEAWPRGLGEDPGAHLMDGQAVHGLLILEVI